MARQQLVMRNGVVKTERAHVKDLETEQSALLQEVQEVLAEVIREHDDPMSEYGCTTHTCQRARELMKRLEVLR